MRTVVVRSILYHRISTLPLVSQAKLRLTTINSMYVQSYIVETNIIVEVANGTLMTHVDSDVCLFFD